MVAFDRDWIITERGYLNGCSSGSSGYRITVDSKETLHHEKAFTSKQNACRHANGVQYGVRRPCIYFGGLQTTMQNRRKHCSSYTLGSMYMSYYCRPVVGIVGDRIAWESSKALGQERLIPLDIAYSVMTSGINNLSS